MKIGDTRLPKKAAAVTLGLHLARPKSAVTPLPLYLAVIKLRAIIILYSSRFWNIGHSHTGVTMLNLTQLR